jgi:biotin carboxylase
VPRVLLILPTSSYRANDFLDAAESLGIEVAVAAEENLPLVGFDRFVKIDCSDPEAAAEAIVDLAQSTPVDAIVPVDDGGVIIAAIAAQRLGLPHNPPSAARATRDKAALRVALEKGEVPQPGFRLVENDGDARALAEELGYPVVVKPRSLSGSRGVIKVDTPDRLLLTLDRVRLINTSAGNAATEPLILEAFLPGPEVAVEGMLWNGELEVLAVFDKPKPLDGPYFEETFYITPSRHHQGVLAEIERVTQQATRALSLNEGPIHAELRITEGRPHVIEVAGRSIGGICGRALSFGLLDTPLEALILRHALGRRIPTLARKPVASGVLMLSIPRNGVLRSIVGLDEARNVPGIRSIEITAPVGTRLATVPEADRYLGFAFATGSSPESVELSLRTADALLQPIIN